LRNLVFEFLVSGLGLRIHFLQLFLELVYAGCATFAEGSLGGTVLSFAFLENM
jgi:hypothetical protein